MSDVCVAVVGAGLAGLVAAHRLRTAGIDAPVFEASSEIGGRLRPETLDGVEFEPALRALPRSAPVLGGLIAELGLSKSVSRAPLEGARCLKRGALVPESTRTLDHVTRGPLTSLRAGRLRSIVEWLGGDLDPLAPDRATRLDDRSVADFARVVLGRRAGPELFAPLLATLVGHDARETSRQLLFSLLDPWGDVDISLASGLSAVPTALATGLELHTGERVESVLPSGTGVRLACGEEIRTDAVVLAVPASAVLELACELTPAERDALESVRTVGALHLAVSIERKERGTASWIPEAEGGPVAGSIELGNGAPSRQLVLLVARPHFAKTEAHRSDEELARILLDGAEGIQPGLRHRLRASKLLRLPAILPHFGPGHYRAAELLWREHARQPERRVFLCGDYLAGPHAEGAAASATRTANEVRTRLL